MAQERPRVGHRVMATITGVKGNCSWGHKVGDSFEISVYDTAGLCGIFYHDIFPYLAALQFGGNYPWGNPEVVNLECMDRYTAARIELRRVP